MNKKILIVDDDKKIARLIEFRLQKQGYQTLCAFSGEAAFEQIKKDKPALIFLDIRLPDGNGVEILKQVRQESPSTHVIMISAHADVRIAVECIKNGAYDFIEKPIELAELDNKVKHLFKALRLEEELSFLRRELGESYKNKTIVGQSACMTKVFQRVEIAAKSDVSVLIEGESGTGKELVARAIHLNSSVKDKPFVGINCAAIPQNLLEDELFGHEKGAFTGATSQKLGKFEQAQGGTLFLDEMGELPIALQVKLLRVLQEREIDRVGGSSPVPVNVRIIAATNKNLKEMVQAGSFREDLYFRINVFPVVIPPLRERMGDIPELVAYFSKKQGTHPTVPTIQPTALKKLADYHWPGNIRELENFVERVLLVKGREAHLTITEDDLELLDAFHHHKDTVIDKRILEPKEILGETEKKLLEEALVETHGNVTKASKRLQMSRDTFYRKMKKYSIAR